MARKSERPTESQLPEGWQRFLSHAIRHALDGARRTPEDFLRHFPPSAIMDGLSDHADLRAAILVIATGVRRQIAEKKTARSCAEDLDIALREGETDPETVVGLFDADDRVRYLDRQALWTFIEEGAFWETDAADGSMHRIAREHIAFLLTRALHDGLVTANDIVDGVGVDELAELLPRPELAKIVRASLLAGRGGQAFTDAALLMETPITLLSEHIPLRHLWERIVVPKIAEANGFLQRMSATPKAPVLRAAAAAPSPAPAPAATAATAPAANAAAATPAAVSSMGNRPKLPTFSGRGFAVPPASKPDADKPEPSGSVAVPAPGRSRSIRPRGRG